MLILQRLPSSLLTSSINTRVVSYPQVIEPLELQIGMHHPVAAPTAGKIRILYPKIPKRIFTVLDAGHQTTKHLRSLHFQAPTMPGP
jgi:hypothetical protein